MNYLVANTIPPVTMMFRSASGNIPFHPNAISRSNSGLGSTARSRMNPQINTNVFRKNQTSGGSHGPIHPPKNSATVSMEISVTPRYSPTKNIPNFMPEYSEWYPAT